MGVKQGCYLLLYITNPQQKHIFYKLPNNWGLANLPKVKH